MNLFLSPDRLRPYFTSNFPMMSIWIHHSPDAPTMLFPHRVYFFPASRDRLCKYRIGVRNGQHHSYRSTPQRFRTEICMFGRLIGHPELCSIRRQSRDDATVLTLKSEHFFRAKRGLIKLHRLRTFPDR